MMNKKVLLSMLCFAVLAVTSGAEPPAGNAPKPEPAPADTSANVGKNWPAVPAPVNPTLNGQGIQHTMRLLSTSTLQHRNHVRILFYGQSITEQKWSQQVADDLRKRFPNADLDIQNRAIGGFASQLLIRPAEHDVYPFYPDLVIFHVYGADQEYEQIIRSIRTRTTAEVLMQRDHATRWPLPVHDPNVDKGEWWDDRMNNQRLPEIAQKYGCGLVDVRGEWLRYLKDNHLEPKQLLVDGVHLNDHGCYVMAEILRHYLVYRPDIKETPDSVRTVTINKDIHWDKDHLTLDFVGNRVDLQPQSGRGTGTVRILIDSKAPSAHPECYAITRPQPNPWASPLALARVDHENPLLAEDWTLTVTGVTGEKENTKWTYSVAGSLTGADGSGKSDELFISKSGRVKIAPESFFRGFNPPLSVGHIITWHTYLMGTDQYSVPANLDPTKENAVTIAQGLENGPHHLELIADGDTRHSLQAIRIYQPAVK